MSQPISAESKPTAFHVRCEICARTEVGPTRAQNQDAIMVAGAVGIASGTKLTWTGQVPDSGLATAVVDGMGGYAGGDDAAALVAAVLADVRIDSARDGWDAWFEDLSHKVTQAGQAWGTPDMGATTALLVLTPGGLTMANVGDCRIYRCLGGHLGQVSVDDRTDDPNSSAVTQALGGSVRIDAHLWRQTYRGGPERYVICSDGVWGTLDPAILRDLCAAERPAAQIADAIIASIYAQNASDNCSVVVVDLVATAADQGFAPGVPSGRLAQHLTVESLPETLVQRNSLQ